MFAIHISYLTLLMIIIIYVHGGLSRLMFCEAMDPPIKYQPLKRSNGSEPSGPILSALIAGAAKGDKKQQ